MSRVKSFPQISGGLRLSTFVVVFLIVLALTLFINSDSEFFLVSLYTTIVWSVYLPIAMVGILGAVNSRRIKISNYQGLVDKKVIFRIPTVARMDTIPSLERVIKSILINAQRNLLSFRIDIIVDEGAAGIEYLQKKYLGNSAVRIIVVPNGFATENGTLYKARANQYAMLLRRREQENTKDVFIYHLDDDTAVGPDTISSIAEFIDHKKHNFHLAQGILSFPHHLSPSSFCKLADSVRPADDLTRFYFCTGVLGTPLAGLHGEHLLVKANVEDEIGWDFGPVKVEDAYFAIRFSEKYPGKSTFLNSYSYGASPATIGDLIKQRRRWSSGLVSLIFDRSIKGRYKLLLSYCIANWATGIFHHIGFILLAVYLLGMMNTSPLLQVFLVAWAFNLSYFIWIYMEGLRINLKNTHPKWFRQNNYTMQTLAVIPFVWPLSAIEGLAGFLGFCDFLFKKKGFDVISKKT